MAFGEQPNYWLDDDVDEEEIAEWYDDHYGNTWTDPEEE